MLRAGPTEKGIEAVESKARAMRAPDRSAGCVQKTKRASAGCGDASGSASAGPRAGAAEAVGVGLEKGSRCASEEGEEEEEEDDEEEEDYDEEEEAVEAAVVTRVELARPSAAERPCL